MRNVVVETVALRGLRWIYSGRCKRPRDKKKSGFWDAAMLNLSESVYRHCCRHFMWLLMCIIGGVCSTWRHYWRLIWCRR